MEREILSCVWSLPYKCDISLSSKNAQGTTKFFFFDESIRHYWLFCFISLFNFFLFKKTQFTSSESHLHKADLIKVFLKRNYRARNKIKVKKYFSFFLSIFNNNFTLIIKFSSFSWNAHRTSKHFFFYLHDEYNSLLSLYMYIYVLCI